MRLFVTAKFKGDENKPEIEALCKIVRLAGFDDFCFIRDVEKYQRGIFPNANKLMARAREELLGCDGVLVDVSDNPSGGRAIEAGMAFGHDKPVIVIAKRGTQISTPMAGIAIAVIEYENIEDIKEPLKELEQRIDT